MKKAMGLIATVIFAAVLFFNLTINAQRKGNDVRLENIDALASCYSLEGSPFVTQCCEPWYYMCWGVGGNVLPGWPS